LAYEPAEANVMERPPRNIEVDRLVSLPLLLYAYAIMGMAEGAACVASYLWTYSQNNVPLADIFLINPRRKVWYINPKDNDDIIGSFTAEQQSNIVRQVRA
jgi:hypothetical protein